MHAPVTHEHEFAPVDATPPVCILRPGRATDLPFVEDSWLQSDRYSTAGQDMGRVYMHEHKATIRSIMARPGVVLRIAHAPDDEDAIMGWAVVHPIERVVFYAYTKRASRRLGIASALLQDMHGDGVTCTHRPVSHGFVRRGLPEGWLYNPARNYR